MKISHPDRVIFPSLGVTKAELARFYEAIGEHMLPHVRGRPLTLVRCPTGLDGHPCLYMRHAKTWGPAPLRRIHIREKTKLGEYLVIDSVAAIVALVQMGVLEIHTQNVTDADLERPDRVVFDLDPSEGVPWSDVAEAAEELRDRLEDMGLESWVKTTGGKGLHVFVPIVPEHGWDTVIAFSRSVAEALEREAPSRFTSHMGKAARAGGRIFIDWLRNNRANTSIAAFSTRAKPGAPMSVPIAWNELPRARSDSFDLTNVRARLRKKDPWAGYFKARQRLRAI